MAKVDFLQIKHTPWGTVVSALVRSWASYNTEEAKQLSFGELDISIKLNGFEVSSEALAKFVTLLNTTSTVASASHDRALVSDLLRDVDNSMSEFSPENSRQRAIDQLYDLLSSVDLTHLLVLFH